MIGVAPSEPDHEIVREFFELFKTPWEFCRAGSAYDVLLSPSGAAISVAAKVTIIYGSEVCDFDRQQAVDRGGERVGRILSFETELLPIYGAARSFNDTLDEVLLLDQASNEPVSFERTVNGAVIIRLGFDLFREVRHLLTCGQPENFAAIPTLDRHITFLRRLIVRRGLFLVEIPPVPANYPFIVALTHDVDHPRVRFHKFDHTMFGFLYRATVGSVIAFFRGRRSWRQVRLNWQAALCLPLVFAGLARDFWDQLAAYVELEERVGSTFFVIPFKGEPGENPDGLVRADRASRYGAGELAADLRQLAAAQCEIAVHGIDAWRDIDKGEAERKCIQAITGEAALGVRMHWLYFDSTSPRKLEEAGFSYDATVGYNGTIGYRAGTSQVYKHPGVERLLELPLHVMDTAMFYSSYMALSDAGARSALMPLIENAANRGGVLTINWHDRSLAPERLWGDAYKSLLDDLRERHPWFATATKSVAWFRQRRAASFRAVVENQGTVEVHLNAARTEPDLPPLVLRIYNRKPSHADPGTPSSGTFEDFVVADSDRVLIAA